nr:MetQ/NlpA family ABC transporter substrate-binding protein [Pseudomonas aeruginosa]
MKKLLLLTALASVISVSANAAEKLLVAATPIPHAEILELIKPTLAKEGVDLQIKVFTDYVQPNVQVAEKRLDANNLPQSWSVQLASLSNRARAEELQKTLRSQGYNAYIRSFDGMNRVFVGPVIQRAEADRLRDQLSKQQKLNGFVVRFQPERG